LRGGAFGLDNFFIVAKQVAILFVLVGTGAVCRRAKLVDAFAIRGLVNVLILLVTPSIVVTCFQRPFDPAMLRQLALAFVIATAAHLVAIALACLTARGDDHTRPVLRLATVFSNAGFMGIPLEHAILGAEGVFYGIVYVAMFNVFMWSWGLREMRNNRIVESSNDRIKGCSEIPNPSNSSNPSNLKMFVNPGTVGIAIGLPLFLFSVTLPEIVASPVKMLADLNTPFAMIVIGYYLAGADLRTLFLLPAVHTAAFVRLVAFPMMVLGGLYLCRGWLDRTMALAMVTAASAPVAAMVTMFASKYNRDVDMSVGLVSGTTLLSVVTMPAVIAIAMAVL